MPGPALANRANLDWLHTVRHQIHPWCKSTTRGCRPGCSASPHHSPGQSRCARGEDLTPAAEELSSQAMQSQSLPKKQELLGFSLTFSFILVMRRQCHLFRGAQKNIYRTEPALCRALHTAAILVLKDMLSSSLISKILFLLCFSQLFQWKTVNTVRGLTGPSMMLPSLSAAPRVWFFDVMHGPSCPWLGLCHGHQLPLLHGSSTPPSPEATV